MDKSVELFSKYKKSLESTIHYLENVLLDINENPDSFFTVNYLTCCQNYLKWTSQDIEEIKIEMKKTRRMK